MTSVKKLLQEVFYRQSVLTFGMGNINKSFTLILILIITISSLSLIFQAIPLGRAQSGTNENGIINQDASWTKTNSPYTLTGNILINNQTTITVEAGTTLNLNGYYIMVNGKLIVQQGVTINMQNAAYIQVNGLLSAIGTTSNPIQFNGFTESFHIQTIYSSSIIFSESSVGWDEQKSSGSIIENTILNTTSISVASSIKMANNNMFGAGLDISEGSPLITDNILGNGAIITGGSPIISNNAIHFTVTCSASNSNQNTNQTAFIANNVISGVPAQYPGITLAGNSLGYNLIIERNLISTGLFSGNNGIEIGLSNNVKCTVSIINNTITNNNIGINVICGIPQLISGNNFYNNTFNVKLRESGSIDCPDNWWGTTDQQAINQSIYDFKNDFNLGTVNFVPFLTTPNPQALTTSTSTPIPTPSPSPTPIPELSWLVILPMLLSMFAVAVVLRHRKAASSSNQL